MADDDDKGKGGAPGGPPQMAALLDATRARALSEQAAKVAGLEKCAEDAKKTLSEETTARRKLEETVTGLQKQLAGIVEERTAADTKRLTGKRGELARMRGLKGEAVKVLEAYSEPALDDALEAFKQRGLGDDFGISEGTEAAKGLAPTVGVIGADGKWTTDPAVM